MTDEATWSSSASPMLEVEEITFGYTKSPVLESWSASFSASTMTAITGPSGRGKSTLLYLLGLMLRPTGGDIRIQGTSTRSMGDAERASLRATRYGFVFQDAALDTGRTVLDNVTEGALYRESRRKDVEPYARELLDRFGVDVPAHRKPGQVSGGQAQRIALARALLHRPEIVLADEPTGNLDAVSAEVVVGALRECAAQGATVVIVTHSESVASACDEQILV